MPRDTPSNAIGDEKHEEASRGVLSAGGASAPPPDDPVSRHIDREDDDSPEDDDLDDDDDDDPRDYSDDEDDYDRDNRYRDEIQDLPDEEKTPVTIVTGFLGAGKTTLVNYILKEQREMKIAVIENEYGAVSIDTALVEENIRENEDIVTMDNGCVCCTVRGDLVKTLVDFLDRRNTFDCILIETTGIADPSPILATFTQDIDVKGNFRVDSVVCLVDSKNILTQLARTPEEGAVNEAVQQLAFADTVVVNKLDLVNEEKLDKVLEKITSINAFARVVKSQKSRVPLKSILNLRSYNLERTLELLEQEKKEEEARRKAAEEKAAKEKAEREKAAKEKANGSGGHHGHDHKHHDHDHAHKDHGKDKHHDHDHSHVHANGEVCTHDHGHGNAGEKRKRDGEEGDHDPKKPREAIEVSATRHDSKVGSLGLTIRGSLDVDKFNRFMADFLGRNSENLFRSKGVLAFGNMTQKWVFQGVHEQINCEPSPMGWAKDGSDRESKIVFIGLDLDKDEISTGLKECLVKEDSASASAPKAS